MYKHHVRSYDLVADRIHGGRPIRMLTVLEESNRECLAIKVARKLKSDDVLEDVRSEIEMEELLNGIEALLRAARGNNSEEALELPHQLVPEYRSNPIAAD